MWRPGYCYLTLFKEQYHEAFDWPAFPTWSEVALWDENLRREGKFRVTVKGKLWHIEEDEINGESWMMVRYLALGKHSSERVGIFVWTMEMANSLLNALSGYQFYFGTNTPEYQPVLPFVPPVEVPPDMHAEYAEARDDIINHNNNVETGRAETANAIGQMVAQLVNELRPERVPHPQIKLDMPDCYEGDPAEIDNWLRSMETYFTLTKVTDLNRTIMITLQRIKKGKGNRAGAWSAVKLKEWVEMEKEFEARVADGTMPREATMRQRSDGMVSGGLLVAPLRHKPPFEDWIQFRDEAREFFMTTEN